MIRPLMLSAALLLAATPVLAADTRRDAILADYAKVDSGHTGFSASRGETLFRTQWKGGDERTPSCTACHTDNPRQSGRNAKTGRTIEPVAVSVNPKRFTDAAEVEKQFTRDCKNVLGRECTPREKGDYITFMMGQ